MKNTTTQPTNTQSHLFGKPLAITICDNTLIGEMSRVHLETRVANIATEEVICTVKDADVKKAESKARLILTAVNEYPSLKKKAEMHSSFIDGLKALKIYVNASSKDNPNSASSALGLIETLLKQADLK